MTELSRDSFKKAHLLSSGQLPEVALTGAAKAMVDTKIAEGFTVSANVKLSRDDIRNAVAYNGETLDNIVPSRNLQKACQTNVAQAINLAIDSKKLSR